MTLQNQPGETEYPVRPRLRYARQADATRRAPNGGNGRRALVLTACAVPFGIIGLILALVFWPDGPDGITPFICFAFGLAIGILFAALMFQQLDARAPLRMQRDYLAQTRSVPLTERQQQLLALDAVSDFSFGGWNSSLAFAPTWAELPQQLRDRYGDGRTGTPWSAMPMGALDDHRAALDKQFRVASRDDIELLVADTLAKGAMSLQFEEIARSENAERMISRIAAITGETEFEILERTQPHDGRPPVLLLAGDTERTFGAIRYAYVAGYLTGDRTWQLLAQIGDRALDHYSGYDLYWKDVAVALAFRTDSLDAVQRHREILSRLGESDWPAARLDYPSAG